MLFWLPLCPPRGYSFVLFLFAKTGQPYCSRHCRRVQRHSVGILMHQDYPTPSFPMMVGGVCQRYGMLPAGLPAFCPDKQGIPRQNLHSFFFLSDHFPSGTGHMYVDFTPSATCFLGNERAQESTVRVQGRTAQENEPQSARRAFPQFALWMFCPCDVWCASRP